MKQSITQKMAGRWRYLLFVCMFMLSTLSGFADHFRYGSLTWQRVPGNPLQVKFTLRNAFRLSLWTSQNLPVTIGGTIQTGNFKPGQGANIPAVYTVTAINVKDDWWYGECTAIKTYAASDTFNAFYNVCCRILNLENNSNATTVVPTLVQVGTANDNNDAPVVVTAPIVNFPKNKSLVSLKIPAVDPNGDAVTFSLAPNGSFGVPSLHPAGMAISNDGWLSWNTIGKTVGQIYNTSVKVTDAKGAYTYVDFLIKIVDSSAAPTFDYVASPPDGTTFNLQPGENITFHIKVSDPTTGDTVTLTAIGLPPGATFNTTGSNPVDGVFGWTPSPDQQGTYVVTFISQDTTGVQNTTTINFNIGYKPFFDIPTTPGNNSIFSVKPGDTLTHVIKAKSLDSTAKIALTMESGFIPGMTFTPSFPLTPANPVSTNFTWVPQMSDWGVKKVVYMAVDTFRHQPVYDTIHYVIDNPPVITSTPATTVNAGQTYTYILSATDMDIPVGDKLKVENITLPSFLSIVSNNNNTWTISGTPGAGDVGTYNIMIEVADSMNHKFGTHDGNAYQYIPLQVLNAPLTATGIVTDATIFGASTGAINITPTGGVGPYTYSWSNSATTEDLFSIPAGTYIVTITDANNSTFIDTFTVSQPAQLTVTGIVSHIPIFGGNNGAIDITPAGGVGPYTYIWNNNSTTEDRTGLTAGTYSVTVTDANGATATGTYTVTQPAQLTATGTATPATVYNTNTGSINITPAGGVGPYTYSWSNNATTEDLTGVGAGTYTVTITDANGATFTATYTVTQPTQLTVSGVVTNVTTYGGNNGAINITPAGGVGPYTYVWNNNSTIEDRTGLTAGTYTVTVTDANGATATGTYTVTQPANTTPLNATLTVSPVNTVPNHAPYTIYKGYGPQSVTLTASATGGTPGYTYSWSPSAGLSSPNAASTSASPSVTTTYTVTITDAANNTKTLSRTIYVIDVRCGNNPNNPKVLVCHRTLNCNHPWWNQCGSSCYDYHNICVSDNAVATHLSHGDYIGECMDVDGSVTNLVCNGGNNGAVNLSVTGGAAPYTYSWSNNATTEDISGLAAGTYTVTVTGADNRTMTKSFTVCQPSALNVTGNVSNACYNNNNGSINVSVSGGTAPYTYLWNNNATSQDRNNLTAGTYTLVVTDNKGCSVTKTFTVTQPSAPMTLNASLTHVSCNGGENGAIDLSVTGGSAPYTYSWNLGGSNNNNSNCWNWWWWWCNNSCNNSSSNSSAQDVNGLEEGNYTVTVTDANGCSVTGTYTITEPAALSLSASVTNPTCANVNGGAINLSVNGGTSPYTYSWSNGSNWCNNNSNVTTQDRTGISGGTYSVKVTDAKGCTKTQSFTLSQPTNNISASISVSPTVTVTTGQSYTIYKGYGQQYVTLSASVSGGNSGYTFSWSPTTGVANPNSATTNVTPNVTTTYTVTITSSTGCTKTVTKTIKVEDVRCGNNDEKVLVCRNGQTKCISQSQVSSYLCNGYQIGECDNNCKPGSEPGNDEQGINSMVAKDIKVYPNPSNGVFTLELPAGTGNAQVIVTDMNGKIIDRKAVTESSVQFNLNGIAQGMYLIQVAAGSETYQSRITIK